MLAAMSNFTTMWMHVLCDETWLSESFTVAALESKLWQTVEIRIWALEYIRDYELGKAAKCSRLSHW